MKRIFITGGHLTPALAVIEELEARGGWDIYYIGRHSAMEGDKTQALEYEVLANNPKVSYLVTSAGRIQPKFFVNLFQSLKATSRIPLGFGQAIYWVLRFRPNIILSFGGYLAVPVAVAGWILGIPVVTHEQTLVSGRANRLISHFAKRVLVSWKETGLGIYTGNPLRKGFKKVVSKSSSELTNILVTGGSQGAHKINVAIGEAITPLKKKYRIIHQTGGSDQFRDYENLERFKDQNYQVEKFFTPEKQTKLLARADLVISRAGANTVTELAALGKVAILIPLVGSGGGEQLRNAQQLASYGGAIIIPEEELSGKKILEHVSEIDTNWLVYQKNAGKAEELVDWEAAKKIVDEVEKIL